MRSRDTRERWQEVKQVLEEALALTPDERPAYLQTVCADDVSLREEVESFLKVTTESFEEFLETPARSDARPTFLMTPCRRPGHCPPGPTMKSARSTWHPTRSSGLQRGPASITSRSWRRSTWRSSSRVGAGSHCQPGPGFVVRTSLRWDKRCDCRWGYGKWSRPRSSRSTFSTSVPPRARGGARRGQNSTRV